MAVLVGRGRVGDFRSDVSGIRVEVENSVGIMGETLAKEVGCCGRGRAILEQARRRNSKVIGIDTFLIVHGSHTGCQSGSGSLVSCRIL